MSLTLLGRVRLHSQVLQLHGCGTVHMTTVRDLAVRLVRCSFGQALVATCRGGSITLYKAFCWHLLHKWSLAEAIVLMRGVACLQISFDIRLMDQLLPSVAECDTIFAASASEHVLISKADVRHPACQPNIYRLVQCQSAFMCGCMLSLLPSLCFAAGWNVRAPVMLSIMLVGHGGSCRM